MAHSKFVHLHLHTQYSLLDGACLIPRLLDFARQNNMGSLAITDHGNMFGAIEFYQQARKKGIKPIIGCEVYVSPKSRFEKALHGINEAAYHLVLLAKDEKGYRNLMKLVSLGYLEGFYYKPRIDKEILAQYSKGLIILSGCLKGEISHLLLTEQYEQARDTALTFIDIAGKDNFYFEIMNHFMPEQLKIIKPLTNLSKELDIPLVATNDVHYIKKYEAKAHEVLLCIQTQTTLDDPKRMKMSTEEFYFKNTEEMLQVFKDIPDAVTRTLEVAEKCNLELDFSQTLLPNYTVPEGKTQEQYLKELCDKGLKEKYEIVDKSLTQRLDQELEVIKNSGYCSYFLIVWDFVNYAKQNNIPVGPGRGSAAGSIVSYALGITDIDPIPYGLLFERFLNPERVSMPDIDIDFCYELRGEVIKYVTQKYSKENVAQIITFGTMAARAVIRDVGRVMNVPYADVDKLAKLIPAELNITLSAALETEPELKQLYKDNPDITKLIDISLSLEGLTRHASTHAAGVVISEKPLINYVPLTKTGDEQITTGYTMSSLEKIGLLKMDFLGLKTLTVINETLKIVKRTRGIEIDIKKIPLDDKKTFELLNKADSLGVFQLESSGMRDLLRKMKSTRFEDLIALLALYRPGPIGSGMLDDFIKRKHGQVAIQYDHPLLKPILEDTYGIILYQEQVMMIASKLAGFTLGEADLLRRAMGKKNPEVMEQQRKKFLNGALQNNINSRTAEKIFGLMEHFAGYGFNKSHSAAYALISYQTAYLKAHFRVEFMTALLTSEKDNTDKLVRYINELANSGINILPPDVNESYSKFTVVKRVNGQNQEQSDIRFGLSAVKNVGETAIDSIIKSRNLKGKFSSLFEFCECVDLRVVNRKVVEALIKCGAFDSLGYKRSQFMAILDKALEAAGSIQKDRINGQISFFDIFEHQDNFRKTFQHIPDIDEWPENQILTFEKQFLGFYVTGHPLAKYEKTLKNYSAVCSTELVNCFDGQQILLGGVLNKIKYTFTKKTNEKMALVTIEDLYGFTDLLVFPEAFKKSESYIESNAVVFVKGRVSLRDEQPKIIADQIISVKEVEEKFTSKVIIDFVTLGLEDKLLLKVKTILSQHKGKTPVYLCFTNSSPRKGIVLVNNSLYVKPSEKLVNDIELIMGEGVVKFCV